MSQIIVSDASSGAINTKVDARSGMDMEIISEGLFKKRIAGGGTTFGNRR